MKEPKRGHDFYQSKGLKKPITVYVSEGTHKALTKEAQESELSLQKVVRRILDKHAGADKA